VARKSSSSFDVISFEVSGNPKGLKRHRTVRCGNFTRNYDPSDGDKADFLVISRQHKPEVPIDQPIKVTLNCYFARPKGHYGRKYGMAYLKDTSPIYHTSKPDADNIFKFVADALNGVFWKDDSCISMAVCTKRYDERPRVEVIIEPLTTLTII